MSHKYVTRGKPVVRRPSRHANLPAWRFYTITSEKGVYFGMNLRLLP